MGIKENIAKIQANIKTACERCNRDVDSVTLMTVSKFRTVEEITEAYNCGMRHFGENRVQEACEKFETLQLEGAELHLIGSLQRNKVKKILPLVHCIQSVDRIELLQEIAKYPESKNVSLLFEVHTGEESKQGFTSIEELDAAIQFAIENNLHPTGFMTMAPFTSDKEIIRKSFRQLRNIAQDMQLKYDSVDLRELSMGMSNDYEIAIEEGSTLVRIGTAIFK